MPYDDFITAIYLLVEALYQNLVTKPLKNKGYALAYDDAQNAILIKAFKTTAKNGLFILDGVVSRKKQIVSALEKYVG